MSTTTGRGKARAQFELTIADGSTEQAMLRKLDEIIDQLAALTAKMDADFADVTNASTDYAASITDSITKIDLKR